MSIYQIEIEPPLLEKIYKQIGRHKTQQFVETAVKHELERLAEQKLAREAEAFAEMYPMLRERYWHQYVAIHNGELIDHDSAFEPLSLRVREQYQDEIILIRPVTKDIVRVYNEPRSRLRIER